MSFEVIEAGHFGPAAPLGEGEISISRNGTLTARREDLELVGIKTHAILLGDLDNFRLGLRPVFQGEEQKSVACCIIRTKAGRDTRRRRLNVARVLRRLALSPQAVAGRYTLHVHGDAVGKKELLFAVLTEVGRSSDETEKKG